jgi:prepilin-type N-terminal cleavage/methylation domain-containing protein
MRRNRHAFTLVELLVVIAVISVLAALLLPALQAAFDSAWRITCLGERKQNYLHATWYGDDHELRLPPSTKDLAWEGYVEDPRLLFCPAYDRPRRTWRVNAARHLEMMFYDQPGNLATWKKNESVPWPTTSQGYYG